MRGLKCRPYLMLCVSAFATAFPVVVFCEYASTDRAFLSFKVSFFVILFVDRYVSVFSHKKSLLHLAFKPVDKCCTVFVLYFCLDQGLVIRAFKIVDGVF